MEPKITLPSLDEIPEILEAFGKHDAPNISDFAIANGAGYGMYGFKSASNPDNSMKSGTIWTRTLSQLKPDKITTFNFLVYETSVFARLGEYATRNDFSVMPRFQNPDAMKVGLANWNGQTVLTIKDKIVAYPRWRGNKNVAKKLQQSVLDGNPTVGQCHPANAYDDYSVKTYPVYQYQDNSYVYMEHTLQHGLLSCDTWRSNHQKNWFAYRPVRAMRCEDGSIQCLDILTPCRFETAEKFNDEFNWRMFQPGQEIDTDQFEIGNFLFGVFQDLERSTEFTNFKATEKLSHATGLGKNSLKNHVQQTANEIEMNQ